LPPGWEAAYELYDELYEIANAGYPCFTGLECPEHSCLEVMCQNSLCTYTVKDTIDQGVLPGEIGACCEGWEECPVAPEPGMIVGCRLSTNTCDTVPLEFELPRSTISIPPPPPLP